MSFELSEVDRQLSGMILPGTVAAVDAGNARVRVESDGWVSGWLPWQAQAAGAARHWRVPSIGEQVVMLCPSGDPAQGFALTGFYTTGHGYDSRPDVVAWQMPDGGKIEYDFASSAVLVDGCKTVTVKSASVTIDAPETTITGNVTISGALSQGSEGGGDASFGGSVSARGDVTAGSISLQGHTHTEQGDGADVSAPH